MNTKIKNIVNCIVVGTIIFIFAMLCLFLPKPEFLDSERREPAKFPQLTVESVMKDGISYANSFMKLFDDKYTPDNFPFRETFKDLKSFVCTYVFAHKDKDGIFVEDGYAAEIQDKIDYESIDNASYYLTALYERFLKKHGITPYISIIPDKTYFLGEQYGYPTMDYDKFIEEMLASVDFAEYIDITGNLSIEDYYKSDTHWRQEQITDIAALLINGMGGNYDSEFTVNKLDNPFYGVYSGRAPKPLKSEPLYYLTNDNMKDLVVKEYGGKLNTVYDMELAAGKDAYDIYLGGERSLVTIENPNAKTDKELVIVRDSFGRSIIPLFTEDYKKITVVDIRYLSVKTLGSFNLFKPGQDVLFLYSTLVLNNSFEID